MYDANVLSLPVDITGQSETNLITNELHDLLENVYVVKPKYTAYYTDSLQVTAISDSGAQRYLERNKDYVCSDIISKISERVGKEVCGSIIIDTKVPEKRFKISYQGYGGVAYPNIEKALEAAFNEVGKTAVKFDDIIDKPYGYKPSKHLHDWKDIYGLEHIVSAIKYIGNAIRIAPKIDQYDLPNRINNLFIKYPVQRSSVYINSNHLSDYLNIHQVTKKQVGLGNLQNYDLIKTYDVNSYQNDFNSNTETRYISCYSVRKYLDEYFDKLNNSLLGQGSYAYNTVSEVDGLYSRRNDLLTFFDNNAAIISDIGNKVTASKDKQSHIAGFLYTYENLNWNRGVCKVINHIVQDKYAKSATIYPVPLKIDDLSLWLDASDNNTVATVSVNGLNKVTSIRDRSSTYRIFSQNDPAKQPTLMPATSTIKYPVIQFSDSQCLINSTGVDFKLGMNYTIIATIRVLNSGFKILSSSANSSNVFIKVNSNGSDSWLDVKTGNTTLMTTNTVIPQYTVLTIVINVSTKEPNTSWLSGSNVSVTDTGINYQLTKNQESGILDALGGFSGINGRSFELFELIAYSRKLSKYELESIGKYLSYKWYGNVASTVDVNLTGMNNYFSRGL